jgi:hypothetical protein
MTQAAARPGKSDRHIITNVIHWHNITVKGARRRVLLASLESGYCLMTSQRTHVNEHHTLLQSDVYRTLLGGVSVTLTTPGTLPAKIAPQLRRVPQNAATVDEESYLKIMISEGVSLYLRLRSST